MHSPHIIQPGVVHVFTFKEGLLSRLAHDLRISVPRFEVELRAGGAVRARFDVASARIDGVVAGHRVDSAKFSPQDTAMIERNMRELIMKAERFPTVELTGETHPTAEGWLLRAELALVGRTRPIEVPVRRESSRAIAEVDLRPSLWGVPPFRTMGGAIGIEDRWRVRVDLALGPHGPEDLLRPDAVARWMG